jgi:hypothetical protein
MPKKCAETELFDVPDVPDVPVVPDGPFHVLDVAQFLILARRDHNRWDGWQDYINTHWILYYKQDLNLGKRPVAAAKSNRTLKDFLWTNDTASDKLRHLDCSD